MDDHLSHAVLVADIEEHDAAVVADVLDPTGYAYLGAYMFFTDISARNGAIDISFHHSFPFTPRAGRVSSVYSVNITPPTEAYLPIL